MAVSSAYRWRACSAIALLVLASAGVRADDGLRARARAFDAVIDTVSRRTWNRDSLMRICDSLQAEARTANDSHAELPLLRARAGLLVSYRDTAREEAAIRDALALAERLGDLEYQARALEMLGWLQLDLGRLSDLDATLERTGGIIVRIPESPMYGRISYLHATRLARSGQYDDAEPRYRSSLPGLIANRQFRKAIDSYGALGVIARNRGQVALARAQLDTAIALGRRWHEDGQLMIALANLSGVEIASGRLDRAGRFMEEVATLATKVGNPRLMVASYQLQGETAARLHRFAETVNFGDSLVQLGIRLGDPDFKARGHILTGHGFIGMRRMDLAAEAFRRSVALEDSVNLVQRVDASLQLAFCLTNLDRVPEALTVIDAVDASARKHGQESVYDVAMARHRAYGRLGRWSEARDVLEAVRPLTDAGQAAMRYRPNLMASLAGDYVRLGMRDAAQSCLELATRSWLEQRDQMPEHRWREAISDQANEITGAQLRFQLSGSGSDEERAIAALDAVEPLRSRTLLERIAGKSSDSAWVQSFITARELQSAVLEDGELLLQWAVTPDTTVLFAVSPDAISVHPVAVSMDSLEMRARELRRLIGTRPSGSDRERQRTIETTVIGLTGDLFAPVADRIRASRRVLVSPDGPLHQVPFALLLTHLAVRDQEPAELVHVPSATLLARQRGRSNPAASDSVLLAATGPPPEGGALPGGRKEVRWLASAFQGVTVQDEQAREASWPALDGFGALHFAAHAESNDDSPWHSGLLLGRSEDRETAGYLEASTIATMRLPARIAVLSACETAFGAILTGEGLTGLASAFLSAGVPTVVATQWKVDDRVTVDLMRAFYRSLSRGAGTARALQDARRVIASRAGTRDPFYWAGFIVVGEPGTTLAINPRNSPSGMLVVIGIVVVLAILALVWLRTHGRGGRSVAA